MPIGRQRQAWIPLLMGAMIAAAYVICRLVIVKALASGSPEDWLVIDTAKNFPRLCVFLFSLLVGFRFWGRHDLGLHTERSATGATLATMFVMLWTVEWVFNEFPYNLSTPILLLLTASSLLVALSEEVLFRGVIYLGLRDTLGLGVAVWGSSAIFTIWHAGAQPLSAWPSIFLAGSCWALMRRDGIGLVWPILAHWLSDSVLFLGSYGTSQYAWLPVAVFLAELLFVAVYYRYVARRDPYIRNSTDHPPARDSIDTDRRAER
jgi:membrane protease YdiL (CAAX protease family)